MPHNRLVGAGAALLLVAASWFAWGPADSYEVDVLVPSAEGIHPGSRVLLDGKYAGTVREVGVMGESARITLEIGEDHAPLHAGTTARIRWNSLVGRRTVDLQRGPESNPVLASGKLIESDVERVELDDVLAALDAPTRANVQELVGELEAVLDGNERTLRQTISEAGPFVEELGAVLASVGSDAPAIRSLVTQLRRVTATLSDRDTAMARTVSDLSETVTAATERQQEIAAVLDELPSTIDSGTSFLDKVPGTVDAAIPLLTDLRPATRQLPAVAQRLDPVLRDLRPVVAELRPTLAAADRLLELTPGLLSAGSEAIPDLDATLESLQPAVAFLRPYTPEVIGFLSNWASLFSAKNASGHFGRALIPASASSFTSLPPGIVPPGMTQWTEPQPGQLVGQTWTDANGDGIR